MFVSRTVRLLALTAVAFAAAPLGAQTIDDGVMMPKKSLCTGFMYGHNSWEDYWEGSLKRDNGNVGTVTTQSVTWMGTYGITDRFNVVAMLPYVWTGASQGVLHGMSGVQDVTIAAKYSVVAKETGPGTFQAFAVGTAGAPASDYTPDFYPMSIGSHSGSAGLRGTLYFRARQGFFAIGTTSYTWRDNVTLNRSSYYTDGNLYLTDDVDMPNVFDYSFGVGYRKGAWYVPISFVEQRTQGGGDIRRQDMPFVSNRMNFTRIDGSIQYYLSKPRNLSAKAGVSRVLSGRNVGQSTAIAAGLLYTFQF
jgi:hypothetical protein